MSRRLFAVSVVLSAALLTSCSGGGGTALEGDAKHGNLVGYEHTQVGKEYWVTMPQMENTSGKPLTVLSGKIAHAPAGCASPLTGLSATAPAPTPMEWYP
ncbi:hypothetical protein [Streptomyces sp. NPDC048385]|uniref:hypothetical protein n=1 Tax=Streptomyces sp. NPDC048385 TaxID=3155145 RepID=UPI00342BEBCC